MLSSAEMRNAFSDATDDETSIQAQDYFRSNRLHALSLRCGVMIVGAVESEAAGNAQIIFIKAFLRPWTPLKASLSVTSPRASLRVIHVFVLFFKLVVKERLSLVLFMLLLEQSGSIRSCPKPQTRKTAR